MYMVSSIAAGLSNEAMRSSTGYGVSDGLLPPPYNLKFSLVKKLLIGALVIAFVGIPLIAKAGDRPAKVIESSQVRVIDGDTLVMTLPLDTHTMFEHKVRLAEVDAFERNQECTLEDGSVLNIGKHAKQVVSNLVASSKKVTCIVDATRKSFGRYVGYCRVGDSEVYDIGKILLKNGLALPHPIYGTYEYTAKESSEAKRRKVGWYSSANRDEAKCKEPWAHRKR